MARYPKSALRLGGLRERMQSKKFFSWFYRVALNAAYSRARRRKPAVTISLDDYVPKFRDDGHAA
jgi:DNA-directed RNA polymerase specialized sigma24 family protein